MARRKRTLDEFIAKAKAIHGDKYDYTNTVYVGVDSKISIRCIACDKTFEQYARNHLCGNGCLKCSQVDRTTSFEEFLAEAQAVHGDKYDYTDSEFSIMGKAIEIRCKTHDYVFKLQPCHHLTGSGCPRCSGYLILTEDFIERANEIHGVDRYDYSLVEFISTRSKVLIGCNECGVEFWQRASHHLEGRGCKPCSIEGRKISLGAFIERANKVHGHAYDYSLVELDGILNRVAITCIRCHQIFKQVASSHLDGHGCPDCHHLISGPETDWLDSLNIPLDQRQMSLTINGIRFRADGFDPSTNTVYEFYGDYWHGNPSKYDQLRENERVHKTFGELHQKTLERERLFREAGYQVVSMWESEWNKRCRKAS